MCNKPCDWKFSSFNAIVSQKDTLVLRAQVIDYFEDIENYIFVHKKTLDQFDIDEFEKD